MFDEPAVFEDTSEHKLIYCGTDVANIYRSVGLQGREVRGQRWGFVSGLVEALAPGASTYHRGVCRGEEEDSKIVGDQVKASFSGEVAETREWAFGVQRNIAWTLLWRSGVLELSGLHQNRPTNLSEIADISATKIVNTAM